MPVTARILGVPVQTLGNWVRLSEKGQLKGSKARATSRCRLSKWSWPACARKMRGCGWSATSWEKRRRTSPSIRCEVRLGIARHKVRWPITLACEVLGVSASGYFEHWRRKDADKPSRPGANKRVNDKALRVHIKAIHAEVRQEYGWPKMWKELVARGIRVGKERVRKLMQCHGIKARDKRKFVVTPDSNSLIRSQMKVAVSYAAIRSDSACWKFLLTLPPEHHLHPQNRNR